MRWSLKIARIAGIDVRIHVTFFLLIAFFAYQGFAQDGGSGAIAYVLLLLTLFACVLLHEFGHAIAGRWFGIRTPDITLLPIGGVARMQRMPDEPWQELIVALAGPAVNVVIVIVLFVFTGAVPNIAAVFGAGLPLNDAPLALATINAMLVLFNLVPAFPMDGGRVLRALLAMTMRYSQATQIAAWVGQGFAFVFAFLAVTGRFSPLMLLIALFVFLGASQEASAAQMKDLSTGLRVNEAMVTEFSTLPETATLDDAVELLLRTSQHEFPVIGPDATVLGMLTRDDMIAALKKNGPGASVVEFMRSNLPQVHPYDAFDAAFQQMQECHCPALPVVDSVGRLVGLITTENIGELMLVRSLRPQGGAPAWRRRPPPLPPPLPRM